MAQPATNPKIEELRFRLKADPKSRLFFPLAEELRKAGQFTEAEQVLRNGLGAHSSYLSAWVSLGRVLRDQKKDGEAVDALNRALQLDPGNVVAARILADVYLAMGEKVEAIKKYKLVHALLPADEELEKMIEELDRELNPPASDSVWDDTMVPRSVSRGLTAPSMTEPAGSPVPSARAAGETPLPILPTIETPFEDAFAPVSDERRVEEATGDVEPMHLAHEESPFEDPIPGYSVATLTVEAPLGMHIAAAPLEAEVPAPVIDDESLPPLDAPVASAETAADESDVFAPAEAAGPIDDLANTITMADLDARQGLVDDARQIYETILARDPDNHAVRIKLDDLTAPRRTSRVGADDGRERKILKLQKWLERVRRGGRARV
jgi:tetratricopeptide (TPR) repeat protein